jgi:ABC-type Fe3+/spermidine/putrescine transport system ATPase subunit
MVFQSYAIWPHMSVFETGRDLLASNGCDMIAGLEGQKVPAAVRLSEQHRHELGKW